MWRPAGDDEASKKSYQLNYLTMCRRMQGLPPNLSMESWPSLPEFLSKGLNFTVKSAQPVGQISHEHHTALLEETENQIFDYAVTCMSREYTHFIPLQFQRVQMILLPILLTVVTVCHISTIIVMVKLANTRLALCLYVAYLSLIEVILIFSHDLGILLSLLTGFHPINSILLYGKALCTTVTMFVNFFHHLKGMIGVVIAVDNWLLHFKPVHYWHSLKVERTNNCVLFFFAVLLIINSQFIWTYDLSSVGSKSSIPKGEYCTYSLKFVEPTFRNIIWPILDFLIAEILPMVCILVFTGLCIFFPKCPISSERSSSIAIMKDYIIDIPTFLNLRRILLLQNLLFLLTFLPDTLFYLAKYWRYIIAEKYLDSHFGFMGHQGTVLIKESVNHSIAFELAIHYSCLVIHVIKFLIYYAGCPHFRQSFLGMFRCKRKFTVKKRHYGNPVVNS